MFSLETEQNIRSNSGSLSLLIPLVVLLVIVGMGAFSMDISHNVTSRTELQSATDAAALAGAQDLVDPANVNNVDRDALAVADQNNADGKAVSNLTNNCTVLPTSQFDDATNSGTVEVDGQITINNIFARLFNHNTDTVNTKSVAQAWRSVTGVQANQMFPLAVSLTTLNGHTVPLYQNKVGDVVTFDINSQQFKNAAFTSFTTKNTNANWITSAIDQMLGIAPMQPGFIPSTNIGDSIYLDNGVAGQKQLAGGAYIADLTNPQTTFLLPVITGDPPYNQSSTCVGFITVKFQSVQINQKGGDVESLTAQIVKGVVKGTGGLINSTANNAENSGMQNISAGTVQLSI